ncbi:MAG: hypothetical protein PUD16_03425 [bacterium]|nr:hypothetical protein [bacterium]
MSKKRNARRRTRNVLLIVSMMLLVAMASVGGTLAWLTASSGTVTNTFSVGDINLELKEHDYVNGALDPNKTVTSESDYKIVPGVDLQKDPFVTVLPESEACWLFVKVDETNKLSGMTWNIDDGATTNMASGITSVAWKKLSDGVYYTEVSAADAKAGISYNILADCIVDVSDAITKTALASYKTNKPTLSFTAYAVQKEGVADAATAWAKVAP